MYESLRKKSRIRETKNLSTDADRWTDTILGRLRDLSRLHDFSLKKFSDPAQRAESEKKAGQIFLGIKRSYPINTLWLRESEVES